MHVSVFDLFTIGIGPSSSHTVGPMRAARAFALALPAHDPGGRTARVVVQLCGSLGLTGLGHGTDKAVLLGLEGAQPETVDIASLPARLEAIRTHRGIRLAGGPTIAFHEAHDLVFHRHKALEAHPNGMVFTAFDASGAIVFEETWFSVGGGFVVRAEEMEGTAGARGNVPYPFDTGDELMRHCAAHGMRVSEVMLANEAAARPVAEVHAYLDRVWEAMQACVRRGCGADGELPGGLHVHRRAPELHRKLLDKPEAGLRDPLTVIDWVGLYAMAVNEENAAGGRVVTAPTNGAAGIIPAVLHYATRFHPEDCVEAPADFLLTAAAIGALYKKNASISGADVGCQGEVGVACSMAAGALAEYLGGTPAQVENAAEIGMEHNLGLTCDPIGGLVQIPCIERNAMGAVKAINASRMALRGDGKHKVSLDKVIKTMRDTGRDMQDKYKETSRGGLAVNVIEC